MGYPSFGPESAVAFRILLYCTAYIFGGAALIGLSLYVALLSTEMFFSQPLSKAKRAKVPQLAHPAPVAEESLDLFAAGTPSLAASDRLKGGSGAGDCSCTWRANSDDGSGQSGK